MANFLYVDNSNVWIEGMHVAAVENGLAPNLWTAQQNNICDHKWKIDFGRLYEFAGGKTSEVGRAVLYGSKPPANDSLWKAAESKGFEVVTHDRSPYSNKEKKVDTSIAADILEDSFTRVKQGSDEITLVAGDSDYVPVVEKVKARGINLYVVFWGHAARELRDAATKFFALDKHLAHLNLNR